ncbi:hypothetical protein [Pseudomonas sp. TMP9]|uniref:hypothetical protein n=1 Tax=Pseudomonas sp. TMP9 TaxID=3133144 RepID=UPI0030D09CBB
MKLDLRAEKKPDESDKQAMARVVTSPECLSATVLTICQNIDHAHVTEMVSELSKQSAAIHNGDLKRAESMLIAQAHTLDGLFAKLATKAMTDGRIDKLELYMRLALKAQNQARATLQTLVELKTPKQFAFVKQANIGNQVQVNNGTAAKPARTRKNPKMQNELLEVQHGERLDIRATGSAGGADPAMATVGAKQRADQR